MDVFCLTSLHPSESLVWLREFTFLSDFSIETPSPVPAKITILSRRGYGFISQTAFSYPSEKL